MYVYHVFIPCTHRSWQASTTPYKPWGAGQGGMGGHGAGQSLRIEWERGEQGRAGWSAEWRKAGHGWNGPKWNMGKNMGKRECGLVTK